MNDPINTLMRAAGYEIVEPTEEYLARNHAELVSNALRNIGVGEPRLQEFATKVFMAAMASGPLDIDKENRVTAEDIEGAIAGIEAGLRLLGKSLHTISFARSTATPNSADRIENLAAIHAALIGAIADAVARGIGASDTLDQLIADSVPEYGAEGFSDQWRGVFTIAAERVKAFQEAFPRPSYHAQKKDRSAWLGRLIPELGKIFEEATGRPPTISNPSEKAGTDWRCPFARFVDELWGYLDVTDGPCPGDDRIKGLLPNMARH